MRKNKYIGLSVLMACRSGRKKEKEKMVDQLISKSCQSVKHDFHPEKTKVTQFLIVTCVSEGLMSRW